MGAKLLNSSKQISVSFLICRQNQLFKIILDYQSH